MATTYGYGGEFSSDDDVDKLEQLQNDRMVSSSRYDGTNRPGKKQIEDLINTIKSAPYDQEFQLSDDLLAGLLDYYKTPRGPIVDSTRGLYHKIALRLIRGDQSQAQATDDNATNGGSTNVNNNNSINIISKTPQQSAEAFSSDDDDDDDIQPVVLTARDNQDRRVIYTDSEEVHMDVEPELSPAGQPRETKQVDLSTTDDESESSDNGEDSADRDSDSDVLDTTPIKTVESKEKQAIDALMAARPATPKQADSSIKRRPLAQSTPKEASESIKKPYTRSQRVATRSATRSNRLSEASQKSATAGADAFIETKRTSKKKYVLLMVTLFILAFAGLFYFYKPNMIQSVKPIISF